MGKKSRSKIGGNTYDSKDSQFFSSEIIFDMSESDERKHQKAKRKRNWENRKNWKLKKLGGLID